MSRSGRGDTPSRALLLGILVALLLLAGTVPLSSHAVPFRPDVLSALKAEGRLPAIVSAVAEARARGLDQPPATPHPWVRPEAGGRAIPDRQAIVLLVDFSDNEADLQTYPPSHYDAMLFSVGSYPNGSMRDWYLENSYGEFNVTGTVTVWLRMPQTYAYYVDGQAGFGSYPHNAQKLAEDAVVAADPVVDFSQFDNDGPDGVPNSGDDDGLVDALFVVHAGPGREETGSNNDIHSHAWTMAQPQSVDGVVASRYSMEPETGKRGVFGHEFGHVLGLPDLYDTDYSSSGVGDWCMMAFGSWGGGGLTPVHFLSWCKARLGFLEPETPRTNLAGASIPQVETNPVAYALWTAGYPDRQYFMVENRQRVGSDISLPGDGLLICHIDENAAGNHDDWHPLVMVEQADGLDELQLGQGSDNGDPYPGSAGNRVFNQTSDPSSLDYGGNPTQVAVTAISNSGALMTADFVVETEPWFVIKGYGLIEQGGNGDGNIDPGEEWEMPVTVQNRGAEAVGVTGTASAASGEVTVISGQGAYGDLEAEAEATGTPPFRFGLAGTATADVIPVTVTVGDLVGHSVGLSVVVGVNDPLDVFRWTHGSVRAGYGDQWHLSTQRNHTPGGSYAWKCGAVGAGNYADRDDAALTTIPLPIGQVTAVSFWHWIDAEDDANWTAWDGGIVEASVDGGAWIQLTPDGGYPYTIIANPDCPFPGGTPCFSGTFDWEQERIDLSGLSGDQVRLRFRFGSDGAVTQEGWFIDDVTFEGSLPSALGDPAGVARLFLGAPRPNPSPGVLTIDYRLPLAAKGRLELFDLAGRLILSRGVQGAGAESAGQLQWDGRLVDGTPAPSGAYFVRLQAGDAKLVRKLVLIR